MKTRAFAFGLLLSLAAPPLPAVNLLDWLESLASRGAVRRMPVSFEPGLYEPARVHALERMDLGEIPPSGEFAYAFGRLEPAVAVEASEPMTGTPYLVIASAELPRKLILVQPLMVTADARLVVVRENPAVTPEALVVTVRNLEEGRLSGRHFRIFDARDSVSVRGLGRVEELPEVRNSNNEYLDPPGAPGFPSQMSYYHLLAARRLALALGLRSPAGRVDVAVNVAGLTHGLYQRRSPALLALGSREGSDADIIAHEYGHAILDSLNPALLLEGESQFASAIHEAFGDMMAYALTGDPRIGEWGGSGIRTIQGAARYPAGALDPKLGRFEPHAASRVVSGIFFDIARLSSPRRSLALFAQAAGRLRGSASFYDLRTAAVNLAVPAGMAAGEVDALFEKRGITAETQRNEGAILAGERLSLRDGHGRENDVYDARGQVDVVLEGLIRGSRPGFNLMGDVELTGPSGYEKTALLVSGHWPAADGSVVAPLGHVLLRGAPAGSYHLRLRTRIGGTSRTTDLYRTFTVR